jgi:hypothetical protein
MDEVISSSGRQIMTRSFTLLFYVIKSRVEEVSAVQGTVVITRKHTKTANLPALLTRTIIRDG